MEFAHSHYNHCRCYVLYILLNTGKFMGTYSHDQHGLHPRQPGCFLDCERGLLVRRDSVVRDGETEEIERMDKRVCKIENKGYMINEWEIIVVH